MFIGIYATYITENHHPVWTIIGMGSHGFCQPFLSIPPGPGPSGTVASSTVAVEDTRVLMRGGLEDTVWLCQIMLIYGVNMVIISHDGSSRMVDWCDNMTGVYWWSMANHIYHTYRSVMGNGQKFNTSTNMVEFPAMWMMAPEDCGMSIPCNIPWLSHDYPLYNIPWLSHQIIPLISRSYPIF